MLRKTTLITSLLFAIISLFGQGIHFDEFKGDAYHIPYKKYNLGFGNHVQEYDKIASINWSEINVSERTTDMPFPDIPKDTGFGIYFHSKAYILKAACYQFSLNSDDGSKLWIEDTLIIDNGGNHQMTKMIDTVYLERGEYKVNIWYQQLYPTKYGVIFAAHQLDSTATCVDKIEKKAVRLTLKDTYFFDFNSYKLKEQAIESLDSIVLIIEQNKSSKIEIVGHTDNIGSLSANLRISKLRAQAIAAILTSKLKNIEIIVNGAADSLPIAQNDTAEGRSKNRRVEITLH